MAERDTARIARTVLGVLLLLSGLVWMGQGVGLIPGSVMSGQIQWFWIGLAVVLVSLALLRRPSD